jgi:hypothetical protein
MLISLNPVYPRFAENWDAFSRELHICGSEFPKGTLCQKPALSSLKIDRDMLISLNPVYPRFSEN